MSRIGIPPIPRPMSASPGDLLSWASALSDALNAAFAAMSAPVAVYDVTNLVEDRAFDASSATLGEVRNVLGTLVRDLESAGVLEP